MSLVPCALFAAIVLLAYTAQAITGFGSTVISITLAALFLPIPFIMPIAVALNIPFCGWLLWRDRSEIDWALLRREVLPLMTLGVVAGAASSTALADVNLKQPFGGLVLLLAGLELWRLYHRIEHRPAPALRQALVLASGFTQGLYASGGPLLAAALAGSGLAKSVLRASLLMVWMVSNIGLSVNFVAGGRYSLEMAWATLWLLPVTALGLWLGDRLHDRVEERQFRLLINLLLLVSGVALLK